MKRRLNKLKILTPKIKSGYLRYYANLVGSADRGAVRSVYTLNFKE